MTCDCNSATYIARFAASQLCLTDCMAQRGVAATMPVFGLGLESFARRLRTRSRRSEENRMSDSVVPTPSEKQTCTHAYHTFEHGEHYGFGEYFGDVAERCPSPVISTEQLTCVLKSTLTDQMWCETHQRIDCPGLVIATEKCECGNVKPHKGHWWYSGFEPGGGPIVTCVGVATEPETPVSEAWGQACPGCGVPCPSCPAYLDADGNCTHGLCSKCPDPVSTERETQVETR